MGKIEKFQVEMRRVIDSTMERREYADLRELAGRLNSDLAVREIISALTDDEVRLAIATLLCRVIQELASRVESN